MEKKSLNIGKTGKVEEIIRERNKEHITCFAMREKKLKKGEKKGKK